MSDIGDSFEDMKELTTLRERVATLEKEYTSLKGVKDAAMSAWNTAEERVKELEKEVAIKDEGLTASYLCGAYDFRKRAEAAEKEKDEWRDVSYTRLEIIAEWSDKYADLEAKAKQLATQALKAHYGYIPGSDGEDCTCEVCQLAKEVLGNE